MSQTSKYLINKDTMKLSEISVNRKVIVTLVIE